MEKFQHVKFACSVKQFGGRPASGALILTSTGLLAAVIIPNAMQSQGQQLPITPVVVTESLGPTRLFIKTADICYGKSEFHSDFRNKHGGHFILQS